MIIAFCGHSNYVENSGDEEKIIRILTSRAENSNEFFLGEYGGFDNFAYKCATKFKKTHMDSKLIFVTPYIYEQYRKKSTDYEKRFDLILYPELENVPPKYAISRRNKWMVEKADIIIAYITHRYGGAYAMYSYAKSKNKEIYNIAEIELSTMG